MNDQRQVIFNQRLNILKKDEISALLNDFLEEIFMKINKIKVDYEKSNDNKVYLTSLKNFLGNIFTDTKLMELSKLDETNFKSAIQKEFLDKRNKKRISSIGENYNHDVEKKILLQIIDFSWRSHLQYLEQLRQVIGLRSYGQKDPLIEFKKEAFELFENLLKKIKTDIIKFLLNMNIVIANKEEAKPQEKIKDGMESAKKLEEMKSVHVDLVKSLSFAMVQFRV